MLPPRKSSFQNVMRVDVKKLNVSLSIIHTLCIHSFPASSTSNYASSKIINVNFYDTNFLPYRLHGNLLHLSANEKCREILFPQKPKHTRPKVPTTKLPFSFFFFFPAQRLLPIIQMFLSFL